MYNQSGTATLTNVTVQDNDANGLNGKGGGVYVRQGTVTLTGCTISGNKMNGQAGAFDFGAYAAGATLTISGGTMNNQSFGEDPKPPAL